MRLVNAMMTTSMRVMVFSMRLSEALGTPEGHHHHPGHVDSGQQRRHSTNSPKNLVCSSGKTESRSTPGLPENFILRKETGKEWHSADGQPSCNHRHPGYRHVLL